MSLFSFFHKPIEEMKNKNTKRIKVGRYTISSHAQNQIADPRRNLKKTDLTSNLFLKADYVSKPEKREDGSYSYARIRGKVCTHIVPKNRLVKTIHKVHKPSKEISKYKRKDVKKWKIHLFYLNTY